MCRDMKAVKAIFQVLCAVILVLVGVAYTMTSPFPTVEEMWSALVNITRHHWQLAFWTAVLALQLVAMKWLGGVWNVLFSLLTVLLMATLVSIAGDFKTALTPQVYEVLQSYTGGNNLVQMLTIFTLWFLACYCAQDQVKVFVTAVVCYLLWLLLTWLLTMGVNTWLGMGEPAPAQLATLFRNTPWLPAALPGAFLLIYAELMAIFDACFSRRKES